MRTVWATGHSVPRACSSDSVVPAGRHIAPRSPTMKAAAAPARSEPELRPRWTRRRGQGSPTRAFPWKLSSRRPGEVRGAWPKGHPVTRDHARKRAIRARMAAAADLTAGAEPIGAESAAAEPIAAEPAAAEPTSDPASALTEVIACATR